MKRKLLTETPVCPRERLVIIVHNRLILCWIKDWATCCNCYYCLLFYSHFIYSYYQIPLKTCLLVFTVISWLKLLINTFCSSLGSTLLFIESTTIHPLYLWVINDHWRICCQSQDSIVKRTVKAPYFEDQENSRKIPENYIFPEDRRSRKEKVRGATWQPPHQGAWPSPWPRPPVVRAPWPTSAFAPSRISSSPKT
jgi:hypothetical protein